MTAILHALTTARRTDGRGSVCRTRWYRVVTAILHALTTARRTDGRGSVRCTRWYRVVTAHDEILYSAAGEPMEKGIVIEGFNLEVEDRFLGLGTKDAIDAHVATMPGFEVVDFWPLSSPPADEI